MNKLERQPSDYCAGRHDPLGHPLHGGSDSASEKINKTASSLSGISYKKNLRQDVIIISYQSQGGYFTYGHQPYFSFAAFVAAVAIYIVVREKINLRRAAGGEDIERLRRAVARVLPEESGYQVAYGHYEKVEYVVRKRITTYYCYAIAFHASRI